MEDEELVKKLKGFYGIIKPNGEFKEVKGSQTHHELARDIISDDFGPEELEMHEGEDEAREFLLFKGYVIVSCHLNYIKYLRLTEPNQWIERQEDRLTLLGWHIDKPYIPSWVANAIRNSKEGIEFNNS